MVVRRAVMALAIVMAIVASVKAMPTSVGVAVVLPFGVFAMGISLIVKRLLF